MPSSPSGSSAVASAAPSLRISRFATWRAGIPARMNGWGALRRPALLAVAVGVVGCACAIYLSWRSTGRLATVPWMPEAVGRWADEHGRFRNLPAYFLLSCPFLLAAPRLGIRAWSALALAVFGAVLELAEYFVPVRMVEWQDIAWSWAGVAAAWGAIEAGGWIRTRRRARKMNTLSLLSDPDRKPLVAARSV
ncbi:hypothetical protein [Horticoccus sp. 23ND18S-11]|uniref:hypothetical protein n=1 Tax=Horticoccus sp. 23ND18S-11 TaxID=3391832 RepID=UPI0039C8F795